MPRNELIEQLERIRRRIRRMLALDGAARMAAAALSVFVLSVAIDWWVHLPPLLRGAAVFAGVWWSVMWTRRRIIAPLTAPIPLREIAARLDARFPESQQRLSAAVEHAEQHVQGASELWTDVATQAAMLADRLPLNSALESRRPRASMMAAGATLIGVVTLAYLWPTLLTVGLPRFAVPLARHDWPADTIIKPLSGDMTIADGESALLTMRIERGWKSRLRAWAVIREAGREARRERMSAATDQSFTLTLPRVTRDAVYWFEAGDGSTESSPLSIRAVRRPRLTDAQVTITPPEYAGMLGVRHQPLDTGRIAGLVGSRAEITLATDKEAARRDDGGPTVALRDDRGTDIPFHFTADSPKPLVAEFAIDASASLTLEFVDADGVRLRPAPVIEIDAVGDRPPSVDVQRPARILEVTPQASVALVAAADDDVDVIGLRLAGRIVDAEPWEPVELWTGSARDKPADGDKTPADVDARIEVAYEWTLTDLNLQAGQMIEYWVEARDNYDFQGDAHEWTRSAVMRLRVITPETLQFHIREETAAIAEQVRRLISAQQTARDQAADIADNAEAHRDEAAAQARAAAAGQRSAASQAKAIAEQIHVLAERLEQNKADDPEQLQQTRRLAEQFASLADEPMANALDALRRAEQALSFMEEQDRQTRAEEAVDHAQSAVEQQDRAVEQLSAILQALEQWSDLGDLVRRLEQALDRQEQLARRTTAVTSRWAGRAADDLSAAQRGELALLGNEQAGVRNDSAALLKAMEGLAARLAGSDRPTADALRRAVAAARHETVLDQMEAARDAVLENRGLRAEAAQLAAAAGLRAMLTEMQQRVERRLEELTKHLTEATERIERLIRAQEDLIARTQTAANDEERDARLPALASRQRALRRTTATVAGEIAESLPDADEVGQVLQTAGGHMEAARNGLDQASADAALAAENAALETLRKAVDALQRARDDATDQLADRALDRLRRALTEIRDAQIAVVDLLEEIDRRTTDAGRPTRADRVEMNAQADAEKQLRTRLTAAVAESKDAEVFQYACKIIDADLQNAATALRLQKSDEALPPARNARDALIDLVGSLEDLPRRSSRFASESASGGGGKPGKPGDAAQRLVPLLAELKILRQMQATLARATSAFDQAAPSSEQFDDRQRARATELGRRQRELHDLARQLIEKADAQQ